MHAEPDRIHYAVVGIGMNVNQTKMPRIIADIATSLRIETGKPHSRLELLIRLLRHLDRYYNQFLADGARPILRRFAQVSSLFRGQARAHHHSHGNLYRRHRGPRAQRRPARCTRRRRHRTRPFGRRRRRPPDAFGARCRQHEHCAGSFPREKARRQLAADHRARSDNRRIRHPYPRSFHSRQIKARRNRRHHHQLRRPAAQLHSRRHGRALLRPQSGICRAGRENRNGHSRGQSATKSARTASSTASPPFKNMAARASSSISAPPRLST